MLIFDKWVLELRIISLWPWECRQTFAVSILRAARKSSGGLTVIAIVKAKDLKAGCGHFMIFSIFHECSSDSELVCFSTS